MRLPTRTAEGVGSLVALLAPNTTVRIKPHDPRRIEQKSITALSCNRPISLTNKPVLGQYAVDVNSQIFIQLHTHDYEEVQGWLPNGQLYQDLMALLHVYLGARVNARLSLTLPRALLPNAALNAKSHQGVQLGRTAAMRIQSAQCQLADTDITIGLGLYQRLQPHLSHQQHNDNANYANYRF